MNFISTQKRSTKAKKPPTTQRTNKEQLSHINEEENSISSVSQEGSHYKKSFHESIPQIKIISDQNDPMI